MQTVLSLTRLLLQQSDLDVLSFAKSAGPNTYDQYGV